MLLKKYNKGGNQMNKSLKFLILSVFLLAFADEKSAAEKGKNIDPVSETQLVKTSEEIIDISVLENENLKLQLIDNEIAPLSLPHYEHDGGGGSLSAPASIHTDRVWIQDSKGNKTSYALEYTIKGGQLIIFENEGYDYYTQGWTQGYVNMATGHIASLVSSGYFVKGTYQYSGKLPYLSKIYDRYGSTIKNYFSYVPGATAMVAYSTPISSRIVYSPVPTAGTKELIVYVKNSGASSWNHRARFVLSGTTLSINTWVVN